MMEQLIHVVILCFLLITVIVIVHMRDLLAIVMLLSIYSLLSASLFVVMDAVDVAFTEAAVGVGISTLLLLSALSMSGRYEKQHRHKPILALGVVLITGILLIYGTLEMPPFGSASAPIHHHVASYYIEQSYAEIGVANLVTSVLASYRGYDTLGELFVIFTAGVGVLALLTSRHARDSAVELPMPMEHHHILRIVSKMLIPFILLFALYVQFHGDFGPGGGFQGGVIFAAAIILYTMIFGLKEAQNVINLDWLRFFAALGVLIYGSTGIASLLSGENFLDHSALADVAIHGQHLGILAVEIGVGITVAAVITLIFMSFTGQMSRTDKA
jgi:multicomponent Na+:H+ antiporter subunit B